MAMNRAKAVASVARRLDFELTPPASRTPPPAARKLRLDSATPPPHRRDSITPPAPRKFVVGGRRLNFDLDIDIAAPPPPPCRRFEDSNPMVLPHWWNTRAMKSYFSHPAPMFLR